METTQLVIDTNIVIDTLRSRTTIFEQAFTHFDCALTAITLYELKAVSQARPAQSELLDNLLANLTILPLDALSAESAAAIWRSLSKRGQLITVNDVLLAGVCFSNHLPLLTRDAHFKRIDGLQVITPDEFGSLVNAG